MDRPRQRHAEVEPRLADPAGCGRETRPHPALPCPAAGAHDVDQAVHPPLATGSPPKLLTVAVAAKSVRNTSKSRSTAHPFFSTAPSASDDNQASGRRWPSDSTPRPGRHGVWRPQMSSTGAARSGKAESERRTRVPDRGRAISTSPGPGRPQERIRAWPSRTPSGLGRRVRAGCPTRAGCSRSSPAQGGPLQPARFALDDGWLLRFASSRKIGRSGRPPGGSRRPTGAASGEPAHHLPGRDLAPASPQSAAGRWRRKEARRLPAAVAGSRLARGVSEVSPAAP